MQESKNHRLPHSDAGIEILKIPEINVSHNLQTLRATLTSSTEGRQDILYETVGIVERYTSTYQYVILKGTTRNRAY